VGAILGYKKSIDKFKKLTMDHEDTQRNINLFLDENDAIGYLLFIQGKGESAVSMTSIPAPNDIKKKAVLLYKTVRGNPIESENIREMVGLLELTKNVLESMSLLCQEVFLPVLSNPQNQQGWSDLVSKDLIENKFH
jgi:dynein heavy chain